MGVSLADLWLPILLATILIWIMSSVIHMVFKYHNSDYQKLDNEDAVMAAIGQGSPKLGLHAFPYCVDMKEMRDPAMQEKYANGPVGFVLIGQDGLPKMGKLVSQQIAFMLIGVALIAYAASLALPAGAEYLEVFRFVMTAGFLTFGWATMPFSIWYGLQWSATFKFLLDALIYGALVAGVFAWMWPAG